MSVIRVITVASRKRVHAARMHTRARTHNGRRSKFYPHLAIIQSCRFIFLESRASVRLLPPSLLAPFLSSIDRSVSPSRVVTYTIVQRANIDKSVGAKTSEGLVPPHSAAHRPVCTHLPFIAAISLHARTQCVSDTPFKRLLASVSKQM